jgi:hypothetical protein
MMLLLLILVGYSRLCEAIPYPDYVPGQWTWISGSTNTCQGDSSNLINTEYSTGVVQEDASRFFVFGGYGCNATGTSNGRTNGLYQVSFGDYGVRLISGTSNIYDSGNYGAVGAESTSYYPSARQSTALWVIGQNDNIDIYLFGGAATIDGTHYFSNELWKFNYSTLSWTWLGGSTGVNEVGTYNTLQVFDEKSWPGGRRKAFGFKNSRDEMFLYGYIGCAADCSSTYAALNDVWKYEISTNRWAWWAGSSAQNDLTGYYNTSDPEAYPAARFDPALTFSTTTDLMWLYGGTVGASVYAMDLWSFDMRTGLWTWFNALEQPTVTISTIAFGKYSGSDAHPSGRSQATMSMLGDDTLFLFGGVGCDVGSYYGKLSCLLLGYDLTLIVVS